MNKREKILDAMEQLTTNPSMYYLGCCWFLGRDAEGTYTENGLKRELLDRLALFAPTHEEEVAEYNQDPVYWGWTLGGDPEENRHFRLMLLGFMLAQLEDEE